MSVSLENFTPGLLASTINMFNLLKCCHQYLIESTAVPTASLVREHACRLFSIVDYVY